MTDRKSKNLTSLTAVLGLAMALGPLTALTMGDRFADKDTTVVPMAANDSARGAPYAGTDKSVMDIVQGAGTYEAFEAALTAADLESLLGGEGPYTVFLPTNEAFERLSASQSKRLETDPDGLRDLLEAHIVPGRLSITDLMGEGELRALNGNQIALGGQRGLKANHADVIVTEVADNGVVHVIDAVL
ncbi:MAG: fasciclin domain-containing protein [Sedimenticolaceae bacterium]